MQCKKLSMKRSRKTSYSWALPHVSSRTQSRENWSPIRALELGPSCLRDNVWTISTVVAGCSGRGGTCTAMPSAKVMYRLAYLTISFRLFRYMHVPCSEMPRLTRDIMGSLLVQMGKIQLPAWISHPQKIIGLVY